MKDFAKRHIATALRKWILSAESEEVPKRFNFAKRFRGWPTEVAFVDGLFRVTQGDVTIFTARKSRLPFLMYDVHGRLSELRNQYLVSDDLIRADDVVIDCGANIGEFSIVSARYGAQVFAFEPDPTEFTALERNAQSRRISANSFALWNEDGEMTLFDANDDGDSSLIDQGNSSREVRVPTLRLDSFSGLPTGRIRLIKLEAEGAEPEIIEGAQETLQRTDYVAVDMGPERGLSHEATLVPVVNSLHDLGFRLKSFSRFRWVGLFQSGDIDNS